MDTGASESLPAIEDRVLRRLLGMFSLAAFGVIALFTLQGVRGGFLQTRAWLPIVLGFGVFPLNLARHRLGRRRTVICLIAYLFVMTGYFQIYRGLTAGAALTHISMILLAGLFFGVRGVLFAFLGCLSLVGLASFLIMHDYVTLWDARYFDPHDPLVSLRYGFVLLTFGGGLSYAFIDIIRHLEAGAERLRRTLQREREERTRRETAQRALERSQRLEALAQLAGGMAHDFNNNLMIIMGSAEQIEMDREAPARAKHHAEAILGTAEAAARSVRQLLTLGRKDPPRAEPIQVRELLRACEQSIQRLLPQGIELSVSVSGDLRALADPGRLHQAVLNLATNARDAMPSGGKLTLTAERRMLDELPPGVAAQPGPFVCIRCSDNGRGIDEATQAHIFEPFFTTKKQTEGSGLGLAVVHTTVHDAGGFVDVDSEVGVGTTFFLYLPALAEVSSTTAASTAAQL